ncbi:hypothetical protein TNCT_373131 [Trichonephila clavata]|uniref:Uncharacterized protein n=1 Tax=Trichonephila clavata TaxID=2740835 RepID=A0A8X6FQD2_TRICU|nr:hypothetical protein TNCT_373131 [Trichonephila clavata]
MSLGKEKLSLRDFTNYKDVSIRKININEAGFPFEKGKEIVTAFDWVNNPMQEVPLEFFGNIVPKKKGKKKKTIASKTLVWKNGRIRYFNPALPHFSEWKKASSNITRHSKR